MNGEEFCFAHRRRCSFIQWLTRYVTTLSYFALSSGFSSNSTCVKKGVLGTANVSSQQGLCYTQNTTQQTALIYDYHNICRFSRLIQLKNPLQWQCTSKVCVSQKPVPYYGVNSPPCLTSIGPLLWQAQQTMSALCQLQPATQVGQSTLTLAN